MEITSISAQLEKAKQSGKEEEASTDAPKPTTAVRAPVSKPNIWATKSWATVLAGDNAAPAVEGAESTSASAAAPDASEEAQEASAEAVGEEVSEGEEESDGEEDEEESDSQGSQESDVEVDDQQEAGEQADHFSGAVKDVAQVLEECGLGDAVPAEEEHIVSGFDEDCGCGATTEHVHDHDHAATAVEAAASKMSSSEPYHSRMMRPSGLASGNNAFTSAAESQRLRLEDDGVGWVNSTNLLQQRGKGGYTVSSAAARKSKPKSTNSLASASVSEVATEEGSSVAVGSSATDRKKKPKKRPTRVACLTTDFAMQNVMMQMDLRVMSVDGLMIKTARQWVLRCMGCFEVHYEMDRLFCRKCGGHHLSRVSASVDAGGALKLHLKKNYHVELRGTKYSLPAPGKQGRYQGEILLREDQLLQGIWKQKCVKIRKDIKSAFGEDVTSDVGMHINKGQAIKIGMGKQNVNAAKGRERRGKSKAHTVK
jgi:rRNA maturation endonuclease Nob1